MFRPLMTIMRGLYLYLTKVIFMLKHSVKLHRYLNQVMCQYVVEGHCVVCTAHADRSPNLHNDVILPNVLT